ncbi:DUF6221 family protein [Streptomyces sp. NPDC096351]|uniref:DUF6221 family protein n=1 Tax=Streptomyces sp. NPDC096351 TaxID=3366087 RepID=UPI0037F8C0D8
MTAWTDRFGKDADLMEFLDAQLTERRASAGGLPLPLAQVAVAEANAVQSILDEVIPKAYGREYGSGFDDAAEAAWDVARRLAVPYDTHPDYREEWRP